MAAGKATNSTVYNTKDGIKAFKTYLYLSFEMGHSVEATFHLITLNIFLFLIYNFVLMVVWLLLLEELPLVVISQSIGPTKENIFL